MLIRRERLDGSEADSIHAVHDRAFGPIREVLVEAGRFGFVSASSLGVLSPEPAWGELFQVRQLTAATPPIVGAFRYTAAFADI